MTCGYRLTMVLIAGLAAGLGWLFASASSADEPPKAAEPGTLVILDRAGKEQKLKTWKFANGTRRLSWLAPVMPAKDKDDKDGKAKDRPKPPASKNDKSAAGLEALEFREEHSTQFKDGVLPCPRVIFDPRNMFRLDLGQSVVSSVLPQPAAAARSARGCHSAVMERLPLRDLEASSAPCWR